MKSTLECTFRKEHFMCDGHLVVVAKQCFSTTFKQNQSEAYEGVWTKRI